MVDFVDIVRRKSSRLRRRKKDSVLIDQTPGSFSPQLTHSEAYSLQTDIMPHTKLIAIPKNHIKSYRRSLDSMASLLLPRIPSSDKILTHFEDSQLTNQYEDHQQQQQQMRKQLYLNKHRASSADVVYRMQRVGSPSTPGFPVTSSSIDPSSRSAIGKNAHDHRGEFINVPELKAVSDGGIANQRSSRRSLDIAQLRDNKRRIAFDPSIHSNSSKKAYFVNGESSAINNTTANTSLVHTNNPTRVSSESSRYLSRQDSNGRKTQLPNTSAPAEFIFNLIFHLVNFILTTFIYLPIWIGIQLSKYTSGILGVSFIILFLYCAYFIFFQVFHVIKYSIFDITISLLK